MDLALAIVLIIVVIVVVIFFRSKGTGIAGRTKTGSLRQEARRQLKLPPEQADQTIDRQIERLKERYPGRSEEWYLEKIIYDLERDQ